MSTNVSEKAVASIFRVIKSHIVCHDFVLEISLCVFYKTFLVESEIMIMSYLIVFCFFIFLNSFAMGRMDEML
jgi:hypothetical protein